MIYLKRKVLYPAKRGEGHAEECARAFDEYRRHLLSIKSRLPESAWRLACLSFHDADVQSVAQPSKREVVIRLDGPGYDFERGTWTKGRFTTLSFFGVKKAWVPHTIVGDAWLYEEMNLSDIAAFDYQVLLWKDEIRIQADDVEILPDG